MKKNMRSWNKVLALVVSVGTICGVAQASIIYDNSTTYLGNYVQATNGVEIGDQITFNATDPNRVITTFKFEYFLAHGASGSEQAVFNIYDNTAANGFPNHLLYTSPAVILTPINDGTVVVNVPNVTVGNSITWSVLFTGLAAGEGAGLVLYNPPTVGGSLNDFFTKVNGVWGTQVLADGTPANFGAQVTAVPEPTTIQLAIMAGLGLLGMRAYRRRS